MVNRAMLAAAAFLAASLALIGFSASPQGTVVGQVIDADTGQVMPCTVSIQNDLHAAPSENRDLSGRIYSTGRFEEQVPAGETTTITVSRGFDYQAERRQVNLHSGERLQLTFPLRRQADLRRRGWYGGDNHVHMIHGPGKPAYALDFPYVALVARAAGLDYMSIAQNWNLPPSEITPDHLSELCQRASTPDFILTWNMEEPKNYWHGDVSHCLGHGWFLGVQGDTPGGRDAIHLLFRMSAGDEEREKTPTPNFESQALIHALKGAVAYTHPCRWWWGTWGGKGEYPLEVGKFVSNLAQELPYDTVVGPTYDAIDILMQAWDHENYQDAQRLWFMLLDKGYRIAGTASTDASFDRQESALPGIVRTYTLVDGPPSIAAIAQSMKSGRNFVTSGPLLLLEIGGHSVGDIIPVLQPSEFRVNLNAYPSGGIAEERLTRVELLRNGAVIKGFDVSSGEAKFAAEFTIREEGTAWYIARCFGSNDLQLAITNPIYFEGKDYVSPHPVLARVTGIVTDRTTGKRLEGECEIVRMVGPTPFLISKPRFQGGRFTLEVPGTARVRVLVPGYQPMAKSVFMDYAPLLRMTLNLREAELTDWRTYEEIEHLLRNVTLDFPLSRVH